MWPDLALFEQSIGVMVCGQPALFTPAAYVLLVQAGEAHGVVQISPHVQRWYVLDFKSSATDTGWATMRVDLVRITAFDIYGRPAKFVTLDTEYKVVPSQHEAFAYPFHDVLPSF
jgi:hypothetical protein